MARFRRIDRAKTHAADAIVDDPVMGNTYGTSGTTGHDDATSESSGSTRPPSDPYEYLAWYEDHYGPQPRAWPALVGDCVQRATAIVRFCSPFYTIVVPFKQPFEYGEQDPLRVVLHLDDNGYVAHTPVTG
jgi:hypothetical protein